MWVTNALYHIQAAAVVRKASMGQGSAPIIRIVLQTDDIQGEAKRSKEVGIEFGVVRSDGFDAGEIDQTPWGKFTHFTDRDGNGLSLHQAETNPRQISEVRCNFNGRK